MTFQQFAPGWRPIEGSNVTGIITEMSVGWSDQSQSNYPIITIDQDDKSGEVAVHCFHHSLKSQIMAQRPKPGERISITMGPKVPLKNNPQRSVVQYAVKFPNRTPADFDKGDYYSQFGPNTVNPTPAPQSDIPNDLPTEDDEAPF